MKREVALFSLGILFSVSSHAFFPQMNISDFEGHYTDPKGEGSAAVFEIPERDDFSMQRTKLTVEKAGEGFILDTGDQILDWADPPSLIADIETGNWGGVHLETNSELVNLRIGHLRGKAEDSHLDLRNLSFQCFSSGVDYGETLENLLDSCFNNRMALRANRIDTESFSPNYLNTPFHRLLESFNTERMTIGPQNRFDNLELNISGNNMDGSFRTRVVVSATVRFDGKVYYDRDLEQVRIRLDRARAGFLNVRNRIFNELESSQNENFRVERPWIYINW